MNNINIAWNASILSLQKKLKKQQFNTWIKPLTMKVLDDGSIMVIAPSQFVLNWIKKNFIGEINQLLINEGIKKPNIRLGVNGALEESKKEEVIVNKREPSKVLTSEPKEKKSVKVKNKINPNHTFDNFIEGQSNQLGKAAALQIANNIGGAYNPFFMYGGVGLGKTHLMQAIGNHLLEKNPKANVVYLHSERFVADMVKALQHNSMNKFKQYYRTADILLIDDIQFFARKERTQEEFFHTFNALLEGQKQIVLTCDKYPKEISGLEDRLKSRFGWGLTVAIEPPELETRVAILKSKAEHVGVNISDDVAFFIARKISSNVRELEGALRRVMAQANFTGKAITVEFVKQALRDLFAAHDRMINIDNIQKMVADYYHIRVSDLHSKSRIRSIARPRQMAMTLAKELTNHSLPEIGKLFGGRDHTTVLHACRKIKELKESDSRLSNDYSKILNILNS